MNHLKEFTMQKARPLPVIVLADTSGSMSVDGKIEALNLALKNMFNAFSKESKIRAELFVGVVTFGGSVQAHMQLTSAQSLKGDELKDLVAEGGTPMGEALQVVNGWLEDKEKIPSRAYRPVIILVSDGHPTDDWQTSFEIFQKSDRAQKATRLAMSIGSDADDGMLAEFVNDSEAELFHAHQAADIHYFFRAVTMSVTTRSISSNPNQVVPIEFSVPDDDLDLDF